MEYISGAIHSGSGNTGLNKILACADLPSISTDIYKSYEKVIGDAIKKSAQDSCRRGAAEERKLVIENLEKICKEL